MTQFFIALSRNLASMFASHAFYWVEVSFEFFYHKLQLRWIIQLNKWEWSWRNECRTHMILPLIFRHYFKEQWISIAIFFYEKSIEHECSHTTTWCKQNSNWMLCTSNHSMMSSCLSQNNQLPLYHSTCYEKYETDVCCQAAVCQADKWDKCTIVFHHQIDIRCHFYLFIFQHTGIHISILNCMLVFMLSEKILLCAILTLTVQFVSCLHHPTYGLTFP